MKAGAAWLMAGLIAVGCGCKRSRTSQALKLTGAGQYAQVLKDFQMQDIVNGTKNMVVQSLEGRLREKDQRVDVDQPHVTFFKEGAMSSVLTAPQGEVATDTHGVRVWGGVTVVTATSTTLTTESLIYDPERQRLMSKDPVRLERPDSVTLGIGLDAEPDLSRVRIGKEKVYVKKSPA